MQTMQCYEARRLRLNLSISFILSDLCYIWFKNCWIWVSHCPSAEFRQAMQFCVICSGGGQLEHSAAPRCRERGDKSVRKLLNLSRLCSNQLRQAQYFSSISTLSSSSVVKSLQNINIIFPKQKLSARCHHCQDCKAVYSIFASIFTVNG